MSPEDIAGDLTPQQKEEIVRRHLLALCEHFECVQILCSNVTERGTDDIFDGNGNWYARQGMAREFLNRDQSQTAAHELARKLNPPPPDDGDAWKTAV